MGGIAGDWKIKGFIPYILVILFTGFTRFYNLMDSFSIPGYNRPIGANGADEGIFLMTAKLVSNGYRMYIDVNTQQGPLFSYIFSTLGGDPLYARLITAMMAVIGVVALMIFSERFNSRRIGIIASIFLTANFLFFKESRHISFDLYSTVFLIFGFFMILIYYRMLDNNKPEERTLSKMAPPLILTGILFSLASMSKLFAVIPLFSLGLYMLVGTLQKRKERDEFRSRITHLAILVISTIIPTLFMMSLFGFQETLKGMVLDNFNRPYMSLTDKGFQLIIFLAYTCIPAAFAAYTVRTHFRDRDVQMMLVWIIPLFIYIMIQSPIWDHYFLLVIPPICYLGARGFDMVFSVSDPKRSDDRNTTKRSNIFSSVKELMVRFDQISHHKGPIISTLFALGVIYILSSAGANTALILTTQRSLESEIADDVSALVSEDEFMISGNPIIGVYADRLQPPEATNLAMVRHPALTGMDLVNITCDYNVTLVIITYHLSEYDQYVEFIDNYYDFQCAYERPGLFSEVEGEIDIGKDTFNVYTKEKGVNLTIARSEFYDEYY